MFDQEHAALRVNILSPKIITQATTTHNGQAVSLLSAIYGNYLKTYPETLPGPYIPLRWEMPGGDKSGVIFCGCIDDAANIADDKNAKGLDVAFGVAPRKQPRLLKTAISDILTLHVDVDGGPVEERKIKRLRPTFLTHSGSKNHCHAFFVLDAPLPAKTHGAIAQRLNTRLAEQVGGDQAAADIARSLRLPGTLNRKNPQKPQRVEIVEVNEPYSFGELAERFGKGLENPPVETVKRVIESRARKYGYYVKREEVTELERLLEYGLTEPDSRERTTKLLIRYYYGQGMDNRQIAESVEKFLEERNNGLSDGWKNKERWCRSNILAKVKNFRAKAYEPSYTPSNAQDWKTFELSDADNAFIESQSGSKWDRAFLRDALKFILCKKSGDGTVFLSTRQIKKFKGANPKNYKRRREMLTRLGILELTWTAPKLDRKAPVYRVVYCKNPASPNI
jgi:hypothetical protein